MLGAELETELLISFFLTFGFFEATESGVSSFYNRKPLSTRKGTDINKKLVVSNLHENALYVSQFHPEEMQIHFVLCSY